MNNDFSLLPEENTQQFIESTDGNEIQSIVNIFNQNLKKKEILRAGKLSELQDKIVDQVEKRLDKYSDEFSNRDLIEFFKTFQGTLSITDKTIENIPQISITQNQLNVNIEPPEFDQDSRQRILNAVRQLMQSNNLNLVDQENEVTVIDE